MLGYTLAELKAYGEAINRAKKRENADLLFLLRVARYPSTKKGESAFQKVLEKLRDG